MSDAEFRAKTVVVARLFEECQDASSATDARQCLLKIHELLTKEKTTGCVSLNFGNISSSNKINTSTLKRRSNWAVQSFLQYLDLVSQLLYNEGHIMVTAVRQLFEVLRHESLIQRERQGLRQIVIIKGRSKMPMRILEPIVVTLLHGIAYKIPDDSSEGHDALKIIDNPILDCFINEYLVKYTDVRLGVMVIILRMLSGLYPTEVNDLTDAVSNDYKVDSVPKAKIYSENCDHVNDSEQSSADDDPTSNDDIENEEAKYTTRASSKTDNDERPSKRRKCQENANIENSDEHDNEAKIVVFTDVFCNSEKMPKWRYSSKQLSACIYFIISKLKWPENESDNPGMDGQVVPTDSNFCSSLEPLKKSVAEQKRLFRYVWKMFLSQPYHFTYVRRLALEYVPKHVLPHFPDPLTLSRFFSDGFDHSDLVECVLALSGMFYLLAKTKLADTDAVLNDIDSEKKNLYSRLYRLIQPPLFSLSCRNTFLRLLYAAMKNPTLSSDVVAAFVKKCCRTAALVPAPSAICLLAISYSILQRNPEGCFGLVNSDPKLHQKPIVDGNSKKFIDEFDYLNLNLENEATTEERQERMRRISLWEIDLLKQHFCPAVSDIAGMFKNDFYQPNAPKLNVDDFLVNTMESLVLREFRIKYKKGSENEGLPAISYVPPKHSPAVDALFHAGCFLAP